MEEVDVEEGAEELSVVTVGKHLFKHHYLHSKLQHVSERNHLNIVTKRITTEYLIQFYRNSSQLFVAIMYRNFIIIDGMTVYE